MLDAVKRPVWAAVLAGTVAAAPAVPPSGERLFRGDVPLAASLAGRREPLPAVASRCINCHRTGAAPRASAAARLGPMLTPATLLTAWPRRGGPPSVYGPAAFCHLLRSGIDPAQVIIDTRMPRYELSDAQCAALWSFLTHRADAPATGRVSAGAGSSPLQVGSEEAR